MMSYCMTDWNLALQSAVALAILASWRALSVEVGQLLMMLTSQPSSSEFLSRRAAMEPSQLC